MRIKFSSLTYCKRIISKAKSQVMKSLNLFLYVDETFEKARKNEKV